MLKNNIYFQEREMFDLEEVYSKIISRIGETSFFPADKTKLNKALAYANYYLNSNYSQNICGLSFLELNDTTYQTTDLALVFLNKLYQRYKEHYCFDLPANDINEHAIQKSFEFFRKMVDLLDFTYNKYSTLLNHYEAQKTHLLDGLKRTRGGQRNVSENGTNASAGSYVDLHNDSPQSTDVVATIAENQYVSDLSKGNNANSGESHSTGQDTYEETETHDEATIIGKLNEIETKYSNLFYKWLNEFDGLFIEEVNYD